MYTKRQRKRPIAEINVVPYIDVMLVLLIIFMITAPLLSQGVKVDLPQAKAESLDPREQEPIILTVDAKGQYYLNVSSQPDKPQTPQQIATRVAAELTIAKQQNQKRSVLVKGDNSVHYGQVVQAMVLLQHAGAESVGLMTSPKEQSEPRASARG